MEQTAIYLLMVQKFIKQKIPRWLRLICFRNISKDWSVDNMKKTGFNRYVYDFSVDYDAIAVDDIQKYLMKKNEIV